MNIFPPWIAHFECQDCGAQWEERDPPKGFLEIPLEKDRKAFIDIWMKNPHRHDCGMFGNGRAIVRNLMRSAGSFEDF